MNVPATAPHLEQPGALGTRTPPQSGGANKEKPLVSQGFFVLQVPCGTSNWWRWAELNRRPKALHPRYYMLSSPLGLVLWQHGVQSAPQDQPVLVKR